MKKAAHKAAFFYLQLFKEKLCHFFVVDSQQRINFPEKNRGFGYHLLPVSRINVRTTLLCMTKMMR